MGRETRVIVWSIPRTVESREKSSVVLGLTDKNLGEEREECCITIC